MSSTIVPSLSSSNNINVNNNNNTNTSTSTSTNINDNTNHNNIIDMKNNQQNEKTLRTIDMETRMKSKIFEVRNQKYKQARKIANALQGMVYTARNVNNESDIVVIKQLSKSLIEDNKDMDGHVVLENAEHEIEVMKALEQKLHPIELLKFCKLLKVERDDEYVYVIQEHGGDDGFNFIFNNPVVEKKKLVFENWKLCVRQIMRQYVDIVHILHKNRIAHRDLSLENTLFRIEYNRIVAKIIDFGVGFFAYETEMDNKRVGKSDYISPEVNSRQQYDVFKCDVWSLGVIFFILLYGTPFHHKLFGHMSFYDCILANKFNDAIGALSRIRPIDDLTKNLLKKMLTLDPKARPTIDEVQNDAYFKDRDRDPTTISNENDNHNNNNNDTTT